jgi:hypothetical protein
LIIQIESFDVIGVPMLARRIIYPTAVTALAVRSKRNRGVAASRSQFFAS